MSRQTLHCPRIRELSSQHGGWKEDAKAFVGREILIKRASPQNHESAGSAARSITTLKESIGALRLLLREVDDVVLGSRGLNSFA